MHATLAPFFFEFGTLDSDLIRTASTACGCRIDVSAPSNIRVIDILGYIVLGIS